MKKNSGITLIALIITIIIMLILVAVSISILINSGIIGKAKKAKDDTTAAYEKEQNLGESISIDGKTYNNIDDYVNAEPLKIKAAQATIYNVVLNDGNSFLLLKENGDFYYTSSNADGYVKFNEEEAILVAQNVKEFYAKNYYKTNDNSLYYFTIENTEATSNLVGENVKEIYEDILNHKTQGYYGKAYFKDTSDNLYVHDKTNNTTTKIGENVKDFAFANYINSGSTICYLTNDKKLYAVSGNTLISENVEKVFWYDYNDNANYECYYITSDSKIYYVRYTGPLGSVVWNGVLKRRECS